MLTELLEMTTDEWLLFAVATVLCVGGLLLPKAGNLLGRMFLGEDPAVRDWRGKWRKRRELRRAMRAERRALKRRRKAERKAKKKAAKAAKKAAKISGAAVPDP